MTTGQQGKFHEIGQPGPSVPEHRHVIPPDERVWRDQREPMGQRLAEQQTVERVAVQRRQRLKRPSISRSGALKSSGTSMTWGARPKGRRPSAPTTSGRISAKGLLRSHRMMRLP